MAQRKKYSGRGRIQILWCRKFTPDLYKATRIIKGFNDCSECLLASKLGIIKSGHQLGHVYVAIQWSSPPVMVIETSDGASVSLSDFNLMKAYRGYKDRLALLKKI
jgi:hypothetical protein